MKVGIVGFGLSGVSVLHELASYPLFKEMDIYIFDKPSRFAKGEPFEDDDKTLLLNMERKDMNFKAHTTPLTFDSYVNLHHPQYQSLNYLPRKFFGEYLYSQYEALYDDVGDRITEVYQRVDSIERNEDGTFDLNVNEAIYRVDALFLCIGTLPLHDPYELQGTPGYHYLPYPLNKNITDINDDEHIGILGSGLASIDIMRYLIINGYNQHIHIVSRGGEMPAVRGYEQDVRLKYFILEDLKNYVEDYETIPLNVLIKWFIEECELNGISYKSLVHRKQGHVTEELQYDLEHLDEVGRYQSLIKAVNPVISFIWIHMTIDDRKKFLAEYGDALKLDLSPMPPHVAAWIIEQIEEGSIKSYEDVEQIESTEQGFKIHFDSSQEELVVHRLINATGQILNIESLSEDHILHQLYKQRVIDDHPLGGINVEPSSQCVMKPDGEVLNQFMVLGHTTSGVNYVSNSVSILQKQAAQVVRHWMNN